MDAIKKPNAASTGQKCERRLCAVSLSQKEKGSSSRPPSQQQSTQPQLKRPSSLTDLSHAHEEQEMEFLKLQVSEQRGIIDELTQVGFFSLTPPGSCSRCSKMSDQYQYEMSRSAVSVCRNVTDW